MKLHLPKAVYPILALIVILFIVELFAPNPINWTRSYEQYDKNPYGCFLLKDLMEKELFPEQEVNQVNVPIFNYTDTLSTGKNYIYISNNFSLQKWDTECFLNLIKRGNNAFIATSNIGGKLADTLHLEISYNDNFLNVKTKEKYQYFENPKLEPSSKLIYKKGIDLKSFTKFNKDSILVLGRDDEKKIQLIKIPWGKGNLYLSCQPLAFTNYNIVQENHAEYIAGVFSYLPQREIVWDTYYKPLRSLRSDSPLSYFLAHPALKLGIYLLLFCMLCLLIFHSKRKQRAIPIVKPLPNTSLQFIQTLGRLYFTKNNHKDIALKKYKFFKEYIRSNHYKDFKKENIQELSQRMNIPLKTLEILWQQAQDIKVSGSVNKEVLEGFHAKIEYIYQNCK